MHPRILAYLGCAVRPTMRAPREGTVCLGLAAGRVGSVPRFTSNRGESGESDSRVDSPPSYGRFLSRGGGATSEERREAIREFLAETRAPSRSTTTASVDESKNQEQPTKILSRFPSRSSSLSFGRFVSRSSGRSPEDRQKAAREFLEELRSPPDEKDLPSVDNSNNDFGPVVYAARSGSAAVSKEIGRFPSRSESRSVGDIENRRRRISAFLSSLRDPVE